MKFWKIAIFLLLVYIPLIAQDSMYVEIRFNEPLNFQSVIKKEFYLIEDLTTGSFVDVRGVAVQYTKTVNGNSIIVNQDTSKIDTLLLITGPHFTKGDYSVCVDSVTDLAGNIINPNANCATYWVEYPLPVELSLFTASIRKQTITLKWRTETEVNNYGFDVERAAGIPYNFTKIGFVKGFGNSNRPRNYTYSDKVYIRALYYYRLKQIDTDGTYSYSPIISIDYSLPSANLFAYPNPANPSTTLEYGVQSAGPVKIYVFDVLGQLLDTPVDEWKELGVYKLQLDMSKYPSGMYFIRLQTKDYFENKKIVLLK